VIRITEGRPTLRNNPLTARLTWIEADTRPAARSFPDGHWRFDNALVSKPDREGTFFSGCWFRIPSYPAEQEMAQR
jgi:hypothetical protein